MKKRSPSREEVLMAFAADPDSDSKALQRYLQQYPEYGLELIDLSREKGRQVRDFEGELPGEDVELINRGWERIARAKGSSAVVADPFASCTVVKLREIAKGLDVPRQIISSLRERKVEPATIPRSFLAQLAEFLGCTSDRLVLHLRMPPEVAVARSYRADRKPAVATCISFEKLLAEAGVPEEKRARILAELK